MHQYVLLDVLKRLQVASRQSADRVTVMEVKQADTKGSPDILEDLGGVGWRLTFDQLTLAEAIFVNFGFRISYRYLRLMLPCRFDKLRRQPVDRPSASVVALESVTVGDASELADTDTAAAFSRQAILLVLTLHHLI